MLILKPLMRTVVVDLSKKSSTLQLPRRRRLVRDTDSQGSIVPSVDDQQLQTSCDPPRGGSHHSDWICCLLRWNLLLHVPLSVNCVSFKKQYPICVCLFILHIMKGRACFVSTRRIVVCHRQKRQAQNNSGHRETLNAVIRISALREL